MKADTPASIGAKERIFKAAISVALKRGFGKVSLDLIACQAGFSKGGLLYHVSSKNDLICAMLEYYASPSNRHALADEQGNDVDFFAVTTLIAAAKNPALLEPIGHLLNPDRLFLAENARVKTNQLPLIEYLANTLGADINQPGDAKRKCSDSTCAI